MTRDLNTDDALYKIGLVLQGQDTSANSGLIEGVRSVLTQEQVDLHVFLTDNKFCNERPLSGDCGTSEFSRFHRGWCQIEHPQPKS